MSSLGITQKHATPTNRRRRWYLQTVAKKLLAGTRISRCRTFVAAGSSSVHVVSSPQGVHYAGLETCGSVWSCPLCAAKISMHRKEELTEALALARAKGFHAYLLTLTAPHTSIDGLKGLLERLHLARRLFRNRKVWKRIAGQWGLVGTVTNQEVTRGKNGWHVHFHELVITREKSADSFAADLLGAWQDACVTAGLQRPNEHGLDLRDGSYAERYVVKWGLALEIALQHSKTGRRSTVVTPWGLLAQAAEGDKCAGKLFQEYSLAFKGRRQLVWSAGLKTLLGIVDVSDEEVSQETVDGELLLSMSRLEWQAVCYFDGRGQLLDCVEHEGADVGRELIASFMRRQLVIIESGSEYYCKSLATYLKGKNRT